MARNGSGVYSVPNIFSTGQTISSADHNQNFDDLGDEITNSVAADGQTSMTGPLKAANGSTASPSFTFASDTDTGFIRSSANAVSLVLGGAVAIDFGADIAFKNPVILSATATFSSAVILSATATFPAGIIASATSTFTSQVNINGLLASATAQFTGPILASATAHFSGEIVASATSTFTSVLKSTGTSHIQVPSGTTAERPSSQVSGRVRYNSTLGAFEGDNGTSWSPFGAVQLIESKTASSDASLAFTNLPSAYSSFKLVFSDIQPATDDVQGILRISTNGGSSYESSGYQSLVLYSNSSGITTAIAGTSSIVLSNSDGSGGGISNSTSEAGLSGEVLFSPHATGINGFTGYLGYEDSNSRTVIVSLSGWYAASTTAFNAIRFQFSSGNIASGTIKLYGIV